MTVTEIVFGSGGALLLFLSLVQISPIKINPWSSLFGWIGEQITKDIKDSMNTLKNDIKEVQTGLDSVREEGRERYAKDCRARILRFSDECYLDINHSKEHYKQVLRDITEYERYCDEHEHFENESAVAAIAQIKNNYSRHLKDHDFLQ